MFGKKEQKNTDTKNATVAAKATVTANAAGTANAAVTANAKIAEKTTKGKILSGTVISTKMIDTIVVEVSRYHKHPKYNKFISSRKRYKVHDAGNTAKFGDKVDIIETRPLSKTKRFRLFKITAAAPIVTDSDNK